MLYVSPKGHDTDLGCDSTHPKQTIGSALEIARISPKVTSVHVCAGTFDEQLLLDVSVDLLGGWSCTTWERSASYGFPSFDPTNRTSVGGTVVPKAVHSAHVGGTKVGGNLTMKATCSGDTRCIEWPACIAGQSLDCLHSIFESWSSNDNGLAELFGTGWLLSSKVPCSVVKSSLLLPDVGVDLFGNQRTSPTSMGAHEMNGLCGQ